MDPWRWHESGEALAPIRAQRPDPGQCARFRSLKASSSEAVRTRASALPSSLGAPARSAATRCELSGALAVRRFRSLLADPGRPGTPGLPGFGRKERDRLAQRYCIDAILVGQRGVDATVL